MALNSGWSEEHFKRLGERSLPRRAVVEILQTLPAMVSPQTPATDAAALAQTMGLHYLPVVNLHGEAVGVVCRCDLAGASPGAAVSAVMRAPAVTIAADADAEQAARVMEDRGLGCLPVLDAFSVVGVVTKLELLRAELIAPDAAPRCQQCGTFFHVTASEHPAVSLCRSCREGKAQRRAVEERELGGGDEG